MREWVSLEDPKEERVWLFDVTFLESPWTCIFGQGCQGVLTEKAPELVHGCCSYGAHVTGKKDQRRVSKVAKTLSDEEWQYKDVATKKGIWKTNKEGETISRIVDGACIFLNRTDFPTGPGCALHQVALKRGQRPLDLKPEVCWQVPIRREDSVGDDGRVTSKIAEWERGHWGDGGAEFAWWCTEAPEAFVGRKAVWEEMAEELKEMTSEAIYDDLAKYLGSRRRRTKLPHPTLRKAT